MHVHGGGRPKGLPKTGGRQKGSLNKPTQVLRAAEKAAEQKGNLTPLAYLLAVINDAELPVPLRVEAAKAALPFCHSKVEPNKFVQPTTDDRPFDRQATIDALDAAFSEGNPAEQKSSDIKAGLGRIQDQRARRGATARAGAWPPIRQCD